MKLGTVVLRVDGTSGRETDEFGSVDGGAITSDGIGVVIDRKKTRLVLLRPSAPGRAVTTFGRRGSGPGELLWPQVVRFVDPRTVVLLDRGLARLTRYAVSDTGLRILGTSTILPLPADMCFLGGRLVTVRYDPVRRTILHWEATDADREHFAGTPFFVGSSRLEQESTRGRILCMEDNDLVVVAASGKGDVRALKSSGDVVWQMELREFMPWDVRDVAGGGVLFGFRQDLRQYHKTENVLRLDRDHVLIQFGLVIQGKNRGVDFDYSVVQSRILRVKDGQVVGRQQDLPVILALGARNALTAGGAPDLWVEMRSYEVVRRH